MRSFPKYLTVLVCLWPLIAVGGGPNDGGTLILHANPSLVYTSDPTNWCGQALPDVKARRLEFIDVQGRPVKTMALGGIGTGLQRVRWDGRTDTGGRAPSGVYWAVIVEEGFMSTRKFVVLH